MTRPGDDLARLLAPENTARRERAGLSMNVLAHRVGVTVGAVSRWESGNRVPTMGSLLLLAEALGCTFADLTAPLNTEGR